MAHPAAARAQGAVVWNASTRRMRHNQQIRACPSPWWVEQVQAGRIKFPPRSDTTPMIKCQADDRTCGRIYPFYYGAGCDCEDCRLVVWQKWISDLRHAGLIAGPAGDDPPRVSLYTSSSPSAIAFERLADVGGEVADQVELASEDEGELRGQIGRYMELVEQYGEKKALEMTFNFGEEDAA